MWYPLIECIILTVLSLTLAVAASAQTPKEIISHMEERMSTFNYEKDGLSMIMDLTYGVSEKQVTSTAADHPGANIIDKR